MILAFNSISADGELVLFNENTQQVAVSSLVPKSPERKYADLLLEIATFLQSHDVAANTITHLIFVRGPGRFTAVRAACIVANAFAAFGDALLVPLLTDDYHRFRGKNALSIEEFSSFFTPQAIPFFGMDPNISSP